MTENNKPLNLLKELRDEIGTAMSVYSAEEDKEKQERMVSIFFLFLCFCLYGVSHSKTFHSYRDVTFAGKWLQILIYVRHLWPLRSESS